jgi:hypothetical protein
MFLQSHLSQNLINFSQVLNHLVLLFHSKNDADECHCHTHHAKFQLINWLQPHSPVTQDIYPSCGVLLEVAEDTSEFFEF